MTRLGWVVVVKWPQLELQGLMPRCLPLSYIQCIPWLIGKVGHSCVLAGEVEVRAGV